MAISGVKEILSIDNEENLPMLVDRALLIDSRKENKTMRRIISDLKRTIRKLNLNALSAPAIGDNRRIFCINFNGEIKTFINPIITHVKGLQLSREKCTSIPGREYMRPRNTDIEVMYQTPTGMIESRQLLGMAAFVFQHEMDHLEGMLLCDIGLELPEGYDDMTEDEKKNLVAEYLDELDMMNKQLNEDIENTPELKEISDGIKYLTGVQKGEIEIIREEVVPEPEEDEPEELQEEPKEETTE